jgi:hypothetical protein
VTGKRRKGRDEPEQRPAAPTPSTFPTAPIPAPEPKSRRELRAERKRQQRKRMGAAGIAAVVVGGLVAAAAVTFGVKQATKDDKEPAPEQTTVLLALAGSDGNAVNSALLAHDPRTGGVEVLMPARVLTEVCGFGNQQLGEVLGLPDGAKLSRTAVSGLLGGVTVDATWVLTAAELARLVDEVGGITVDVDVNVVQKRPDGSRVLVVQRGAGQHLSGEVAATYAAYSISGETAAGNLVRLQGVLDGLLAALPTDEGKVERLVGSLGKTAQSSFGAKRLSATLAGLAAAARADDVLPTDLPVQKIDAGGPPAYRVDTAATKQFVETNLAASLPASARGERTRVFVQNGVGTPGLVITACNKLVDAGYAFAGSGNASDFNHATSKVLVFDRSVASAELGNAVARSLRLPTSDVAVSTQGQNVADVLVILGKDYKP